MSSCGIEASQTRILIEPGASAHTFDSSSEEYELLTNKLSSTQKIIDNSDYAIRGTRSHFADRRTLGPISVGGQIAMNPTPIELDLWLNRALGGTKSVNDIPLAETLPAFGALVYMVTENAEYTDCKVDRLILRGQTGGHIEMIVEIIGKTRVLGTSFPSGTSIDDGVPYSLSDAVLTLEGTARPFDKFVLVVDNKLRANHENSLTVPCLTASDRSIMLSTSIPFNSANKDLHSQAIADAAGAGGSLVFTNGSLSSTWTFGNLQWMDPKSVAIDNKATQLRFGTTYRAFKTGSTDELVVANVSS